MLTEGISPVASLHASKRWVVVRRTCVMHGQKDTGMVTGWATGRGGALTCCCVPPAAQWMATMVWRRHGLRVLRLTLAQVGERGRLGAEGDLVIDGTTIAVTYYRAGYAPTDYPTEAEWRARCAPQLPSICRCVAR